MFLKHVTKNMSAYCHGELSAEEARHFNEHVLACARCRAQFEEVKVGIKFAEQLSQLPAPETLWRDLNAKLDATPSLRYPRIGLFAGWQMKAAAALVLLFIVVFGYWMVHRDQPKVSQVSASWRVRRLDGTPRIGSKNLQNNGQLAVGEWLETDDNSRAQIAVASIGQVDIDSNTRVRLVQTQPTEHRLELARGKMSARIWAPPRLFFVDTPSAVAADLGCAYTLEVDESGSSLLRVTSGWVALELKDRESMVPSGAACRTRPGIGPGTPYFEDAAPEFRQALSKIDFSSDHSFDKLELDVMLKHSRPRDTLTLWHLLDRVNGNERVKVYEKIVSFVPLPAGVTRDGILNLDPTMLETWRDQIEPTWAVHTSIPKKVAEAYWRMKNGVERSIK